MSNTMRTKRNSIDTDVTFGVEKYYNVKTSTVVKLQESFVVHTETGAQTLTVDILADFETIPVQYHEIFLNVLTSKYLHKVSFGDNPFSNCMPLKHKRWWQFWKS